MQRKVNCDIELFGRKCHQHKVGNPKLCYNDSPELI